MSLSPPAGKQHAKNEIIQGLRLLRRRRNYSAHLFAQHRMRRTSQLVGLDFSTGRSISLLPVMASVAKARLIFMTFRELRLTRRLNWRNAFSYLRVREAILASLGKWTVLIIKDFPVHCVYRDLYGSVTWVVLIPNAPLME